MNRTLLVEEGDDEVANRQDKKKREKEKMERFSLVVLYNQHSKKLN